MQRHENLAGKTFGSWTVLERDTNKNSKKTFWKCRCKCGRIYSVRADALKSGRTSMCKHCIRLIDLTGQNFGDWYVIGKSQTSPKKWKCQCRKCGAICDVHGSNLRSGKSKGCISCRGDKLATHRMTNHRLYGIWHHIKERCLNSNSDCYHNYGGRGISVCDEWKNSFVTFYKWSITHGYKDDLTIDRIDVNGGYCPDNCRWLTRKEQLQNTRRTIRVTYKGVTASLSHVCKTFGFSFYRVRQKMKAGMSFEEAVTQIKGD